MDFTVFLSFEVVEEIFSYLSVKDLARCTKVSVKWREAANNNILWRRICNRLLLKDPSTLCHVKSNFRNRHYRFRLLELSDRLSPVSNWKRYYSQQKYISYNWHRGHYVTNLLNDIKRPRDLSFVSTEDTESCIPFFPVIEQIGDNCTFSILRIDGEPTKMCHLEEDHVDNISVVCVFGDTIAYVIKNKLKITRYQNGGFSTIHEYNMYPSVNEVRLKTLDELQSSTTAPYFIHMNSDYLVAGHSFYYFHIWDRKTGNKVGFVEYPVHKPLVTAFCLHSNLIYFAIDDNKKAYEYDIIEKRLTVFSTVPFSISRILSNERYLIVVLDMYLVRTGVLIYDRMCKERLNHFILTDSKFIVPKVLLKDNLLFCLDSCLVKVIYIPSCMLKTKFVIPRPAFKMYVRQKLVILNFYSEIQVWNWEKGDLLYIPSVDYPSTHLYYDMVRLILFHESGCKAKMIGFW